MFTLGLERNNLARMIQCALEQHPSEGVAELEEMAQRWTEDVDAFAAFLVGSKKIDGDLKHSGGYPCKRSRWEFFLDLCKALSTSLEPQAVRDDPEKTERHARIGQWPGGVECTQVDYHYAKLFLGEARCKGGDWYRAVWCRAWVKNPESWEAFVLRGIPPSLTPLNFRDGGWHLAEGLISAIRLGMIRVPEERALSFVLAFARWVGASSRYACITSTLAWELGIPGVIEEMGVEDLQHFATSYGRAARELGWRGIPLALPLVQETKDWVKGRIAKFDFDGGESVNIVGDARRFLESSDPCLRWRLWNFHTSYREGWEGDTPVIWFELERLAPGEVSKEGPGFPTYEEALAAMRVTSEE